MTLNANENYYLFVDAAGANYDSDSASHSYPLTSADVDVTAGTYTLERRTSSTYRYNMDQITAITDATVSPPTLGSGVTTTDGSLNLRNETTPRGYQINPNVTLHGIQARLSPHIVGQTRAFIQNGAGETLAVKDISGLNAGDTFQIITLDQTPVDIGEYVTWDSNADWDAASSRANVVTRNIGVRSASQIWQGWDPEWTPAGYAKNYWTLDETDTASTTVTDSIGGANGTRTTGVSLGNRGLMGSNAMAFDGLNSIDLGKPATMNHSGTFSVVMGVRRNTLNARQNLMAHGFNQPGDWSFEIRDNGRLYFFYGDSGGTLNGATFHYGSMTSEWHLCGLVYRGSGEATVWLDDVPVRKSLGGTGRPAPSGGNAALARFGARDYYKFDGMLSDVLYFDGAISDTLYTHLYNALSSGRLTTATKSSSWVADSVEVDANIHPNAHVTMTVYLDSSDTGTANEQQSIPLSDGRNTYDLTEFNAGGKYWATFELGSTNPTVTAKIHSASIKMKVGGGAGSVGRTEQGVLQTRNGVILTK